jgi:hypothetical protein
VNQRGEGSAGGEVGGREWRELERHITAITR